MKENKTKEVLRKQIEQMMERIKKDSNDLEAAICILYELESESHIACGWKRKGRELGFVL